MINTKFIISTVVGSAFAISILTVPAISLAESSQSLNNSFILAQAHQHGHDKESEHGGHGKNKGEDNKHDDKKSGGMKKDKPDYAHMVISHADALKLNDEQLGKIVRLHLKNEQEHEQLKEKLKKGMQAFKKESMKPSTSDVQLHKLGKDHTDAFNAMVEHHVKERHAIHAILSEDQKKQLNAMKMDHDTHDGNQGGGHNHH
ncbi:MAG TPA: Spy/CpxP family protein refolding chaperone [Nitrosomonas sp.]|nr:Spy/CpxP family protein refolding chaperone [Nitrosomonas sp.]HRB97573.1 Spy/CpxP family protein refolding chaperone [Nitrosomonas sp.]